MIITISGNPGSGKSTVAKILVEKLNFERVYVGGIRREIAKERGMTLQELNEYAKTHSETDTIVDERAAQQARELNKKSKKGVVVEGRTQFHFLPESIKILIKVDPIEGAKRIWNDLHNQQASAERNESTFSSVEELKQANIKRDKEDAERYLKYYGFDHRQESNYDLIMDTTKISAEQAADKIIEYIKRVRKK